MTNIRLTSGRIWNPGIDPFDAQRAAEHHRDQILASEVCGCIGCEAIFPPSAIEKWWDDGQTACCPKCGLASVVIGSASGLPIEAEYLSMAGAHLLG